MRAEFREATRLRGRAFERIMLLAGDDVIEAAHRLNAAAAKIDWQATGKLSGTLDDWRDRNRTAYARINEFHDHARVDLGVQGRDGRGAPGQGLVAAAGQTEQFLRRRGPGQARKLVMKSRALIVPRP